MHLYEELKAQFQAQQLAKNAESIRTHHPEYRRHQRAIAEEVKVVEAIFQDTLQDEHIATLIETMFHFQALGHPTNVYEFPKKWSDDEQKLGYEIHRKPETPAQREARIRRFEEMERAKNPPPEDDEDDN